MTCCDLLCRSVVSCVGAYVDVQCVCIDSMDVETNGSSVWVCYETRNTVKICVYVVYIVVCAYVTCA